jgi:8-oxo-dGTP pyrophosphatase MutT (NUDIX family)
MNALYVAAGVIIRKGDGDVQEVLMLKRSKKEPSFPLQWEFPKGKCEPGKDDDMSDCLKREVKEETGLDIKPVRLIDKNIFERDEGRFKIIFYNYLCKMLDPDQKVHISKEHLDYKWVSEVGEVELMATPEQKKTIQKVLNRDRSIVSYPKKQPVGESVDFYLNAIQENTLTEEPLTALGVAGAVGSGLLKVYIAAILIKMAKDVFRINFTKIGRQCKDYPGGEKGICMLRAKLQAKKAELSKLKSVVDKCSKDKNPDACRQKVSGRLNAIQQEVSYLTKRVGELRSAPIVH